MRASCRSCRIPFLNVITIVPTWLLEGEWWTMLISVAWLLTQLEPESPHPLLKKCCWDCIDYLTPVWAGQILASMCIPCQNYKHSWPYWSRTRTRDHQEIGLVPICKLWHQGKLRGINQPRMTLTWNISQVQQRGLSPHQFLDLVSVEFWTL